MSNNDSNQQNEAGPREMEAAGLCARTAAKPQNARKGKIARLPLAVRTELNQRLRDGEKGAGLLRWLNGLPEVKQAMREHFAGAELHKVNLARWRGGGYEDWLAEEQTKEAAAALAHRAAALEGVSLAALTQNMALVTIARLAVELRRIEAMEDDEARFKCLRDLLWGVIFMRRSEAESERLKRELERKAGFRLSQEELEKQVWLWAAVPENKESLRRRLFMSKEEKEAAMDQILTDDASYWLADEAYILAHGGKLGAKIPEEFTQAMNAKKLEEPQQEPCPARLPEPRHPAAGSR
jgi:hypothetical protein